MEREAFKDLEEAMISASYARKDRVKIMKEIEGDEGVTERESNLDSSEN